MSMKHTRSRMTIFHIGVPPVTGGTASCWTEIMKSSRSFLFLQKVSAMYHMHIMGNVSHA